MAQKFTPYSSAKPYFAAGAPAGVPEYDALRLQSYELYEQMYWNHPETYKIVIRGEEQQPIYLPNAREIVEATNRFLATEWTYAIGGTGGASGTGGTKDALDLLLQNTFAREKVYTKFATQRRYGLIRGDAVWHITADDTKEQGKRVSLHEVHPGQYFPILDDDDRRVGVHLVDEVADPRDPTKLVNRRQTYRRTLDDAGNATGEVTTELTLFEPGKWNDMFLKPNELKIVQVLRPAEPLPPAITEIPVYHIQNTHNSGWTFGSSVLRGIETVLAATQQGVTDQGLAVALGGLGVFWTDAGPPRDAEGNITAWQMGPGQITELPAGSNFGRAGELASVAPSVDHLNFIGDRSRQGIGISDIATGRVDVTVAESGISLYLQLSPLLAANAEREQAMLPVYDQLFYDLRTMWFPAYEQLAADDTTTLTAVVGDPMPQNRDTQITELIALKAAGMILPEMFIAKLTELGYEFPPGAAELLAAQAAAADPFAQRVNQEIGTGGSNTNGNSASSGTSQPAQK